LGAAEREQAAAVQALLGAGTKVNPTNPTDESQNEAEYIFAEMHGFSLRFIPFIAFRVHCLYGVAVYHSQ
jgi:hypothetical protein